MVMPERIKINFGLLHENISMSIDREDFEEVNARIESLNDRAFDAKAWLDDVLDNHGVTIWEELEREKQDEIVSDLIARKAPKLAVFIEDY